MSMALLVMTDGRFELFERTMKSLFDNVVADWTAAYIHDDSGEATYRLRLENWVDKHDDDGIFTVASTGDRSGFGGAIRSAWSWLSKESDCEWVFHLEDDFLFTHRVDLTLMRGLLIDYPYLAQMALKRQPWGSDLGFANGFMEAAPEWYTECEDDDDYWVETRRNWTTNPSLFRADLLKVGWPEDPFSEGKFGFVLKDSGLPWGVPGDEVRFGILGRISDPPLVHHIGDYRVGTGY